MCVYVWKLSYKGDTIHVCVCVEVELQGRYHTCVRMCGS